ncbi:hypothetical protein [Laribacter hongkongensis]|uniref:hypothetical protein n=1 Tax=Laribacter hongkongensis TaxID=168471 RepID=UPI001EFE5214|nr:hypothetical protein [Laribacter hongkongensis]MCG9093941.1 hypothetical protein [Laribacter hongkongensis]
MTMRSKLLLLVGLALSGLLLLSVLGLHSLRTSMLDDRMQKMRSLVETALTTVTYYEGEAAGWPAGARGRRAPGAPGGVQDAV